jgi:hypothetical protein
MEDNQEDRLSFLGTPIAPPLSTQTINNGGPMKLLVTIAVLMTCTLAIAQSNTSPGGTPSPSNDATMGQDISNSSDTGLDPNVTGQQKMEDGSNSSEDKKRKSQSSGSIQDTTTPSTTSP